MLNLDLNDVIHTKVMPSAECHNNYHLVRCKIRLHFKPTPRKGGLPQKKFNLNKLQSAEVKADFKAGLLSKFENSDCPEDTSPETLWNQLKSAILQTSEEVQEEQRLVRREWPRDSGTASEKGIIPLSPTGSLVMSCGEDCLLSHLQHPSAQASRDPKWVVDQSHKEN